MVNDSEAGLQKLEQLRHMLEDAKAEYSLLTHSETVISAEEGAERGFGSLAVMAPTLILSSEQGYIAAILSGATRISYKKIRKELGLKNVALAQPDIVQQVTGSAIGTVSLINPGLLTILDVRLTEMDRVYGGCGLPQHTLRIRTADLVALTQARVFDFAEWKAERQNE